jgi:Fe-Mn family superoxide dismutase
MYHSLPALPYDAAALEPHIDAQTMQIHHGKHHAAYVNNLNAAIEKHPELAGKSAEDLIKQLGAVPEAIRTAVHNNGGGHVNHTMFWQIMGPAKGGAPTGAIAQVITNTFGGFDSFKDQMNKGGAGRFGSGWVWLVDNGGKLAVESTANQDNPIMEGTRSWASTSGSTPTTSSAEPAAGLSRGVVERHRLGCGQPALETAVQHAGLGRGARSSTATVTVPSTASVWAGNLPSACAMLMSPRPERGFSDAIAQAHGVEPMPARVDAIRRPSGASTMNGRQGGRRAIVRRNGTSSMYAFDRHDVGLPGMPNTGMGPMCPNAVGLPGFTAIP